HALEAALGREGADVQLVDRPVAERWSGAVWRLAGKGGDACEVHHLAGPVHPFRLAVAPRIGALPPVIEDEEVAVAGGRFRYLDGVDLALAAHREALPAGRSPRVPSEGEPLG